MHVCTTPRFPAPPPGAPPPHPVALLCSRLLIGGLLDPRGQTCSERVGPVSSVGAQSGWARGRPPKPPGLSQRTTRNVAPPAGCGGSRATGEARLGATRALPGHGSRRGVPVTPRPFPATAWTPHAAVTGPRLGWRGHPSPWAAVDDWHGEASAPHYASRAGAGHFAPATPQNIRFRVITPCSSAVSASNTPARRSSAFSSGSTKIRSSIDSNPSEKRVNRR